MSKKLIMLVDDNDTDNFINKRAIERAGISDDIVIKNSGLGALEYFRDHLDDLSMLPDLVFLDINMPMVDGFDFLYKYAGYPACVKDKCKIVVLSSSDNKKDMERIAQDYHVTNYILKPLMREDLNNLRDEINNLPKTPGGWDI
jgi:CheY-like chemotaxis protein